MLFEERDDAIHQVPKTPDAITPHVLAVVVVAPVDAHETAPKKLLQRMEHFHATCTLHNSKFRLDLPAQSALAIAENRHTEAAFTVYEPDHPLDS
jgi:hypothetical protein